MADEIEEAFLAFHAENPLVYETLVRLTRKAIAAGRNRIGIKMLWEVMRWEMFIDTTDGASDFKLCNNYHALYARLLLAQEPDCAGVFVIRGDRPTPVVGGRVERRRIIRTPSKRTLQQRAEAIGPLPMARRGNMKVVAGASDASTRPRRTRGASSRGTGHTPEERQRARERNRERRAAENSARAI